MPSFDAVGYLLTLINASDPDLPQRLDLTNVTFGIPSALSNAPGEVNTSLPLTAVNGQGYSETVNVYYTRIDVASYLTEGGVTAPSLDDALFDDWASFFTAFNAKYGTFFGVLETPPNVFPNNTLQSPLTVTIGPRSLLFVGSFQVALEDVIPSLALSFPNRVLNGLIPPIASI